MTIWGNARAATREFPRLVDNAAVTWHDVYQVGKELVTTHLPICQSANSSIAPHCFNGRHLVAICLAVSSCCSSAASLNIVYTHVRPQVALL